MQSSRGDSDDSAHLAKANLWTFWLQLQYGSLRAPLRWPLGQTSQEAERDGIATAVTLHFALKFGLGMMYLSNPF